MNPDDLALPMFCPYCGHTNNRHHGMHGPAVPEDGDIGLCWGCSKVFVFEGGTARLPTATEQAEIDSHPDIPLAQAVQRESYSPDEAVALVREILADDDVDMAEPLLCELCGQSLAEHPRSDGLLSCRPIHGDITPEGIGSPDWYADPEADA